MSMILAAATSQPSPAEQYLVLALFAVLVLSTLASPWLAILAGVFTPGSLQRRQRLGPHESPWLLVSILAASIGAFFFAGATASAMSGASKTTRDLGAMAGGEVAAIALILVLHRTMRHNGLRRLGLDGRRAPQALAQAMLGCLAVVPWVIWVLYGLNSLVVALEYNLPTEHTIFRQWQVPGVGTGFKTLALLAAVVIAPVAEELTFRGLIQTLMRRITGGAWLAILVTAAIFAAIHYDPDPKLFPFGWLFIPPIFVLSVGLGWAYERTGNLWVAIFMHVLFNAMQFSLFFLKVG